MDDAAPDPGPRHGRLWLALLLALGVALRLTGREVHSLWFDEAATLAVAEADDPLALLLQDRHPPLSGLLFRVWLAVVPAEDAWLRLLPALASSLALVLFAGLARCLLPPAGCLAAVALLSVSPFSVWLAHEVRMYAFVDLAALVALLGVEAWRRGRTRLGCSSIAAGTALAVGFHYMGGLVAAAVFGCLAVEVVGRRVSVTAALLPAAAAVLGVAVWSPWLVHALPRQLATAWGWSAPNVLPALLELPARYLIVDASVVPGAGRPVVLALGAWLVLLALVHAVQAWRRRALEDLRLLALWTAPIAASLMLWPVLPPSCDARTLIVAAPGSVAAIGSGLSLLGAARRRGASATMVLVAVATVAACLAVTLLHRAGNRREDYRSACADIVAAWRPGDWIVAVSGTPEPFSQHPLRHYLRGRPEVLAAIVDRSTLPAAAATWPAGTRLHVVHRIAEYARADLQQLVTSFAPVATGPARFRIQVLVLRTP